MIQVLAVFLALSVGCGSTPKSDGTHFSATPDSLLWLEEVKGVKPLEWVHQRNQTTFQELKSKADYSLVEREAKKIILAKDRLPSVVLRNHELYNFWQDDVHVRGIWRKTSVREYKKTNPRWEVILDLDQLAKAENENWVYKGMVCLEPEVERCLIRLSRGGKDAVVVREFDVLKKKFVKDGFHLAEAKNQATWIDRDHLVVGTDFGPDSFTNSGYPRLAKIWTRGQPLAQANQVFAGKNTDVSVSVHTIVTPEGRRVIVDRGITFYESENFVLGNNNQLQKIEKPLDAELMAWIYNRYIVRLKSPLNVDAQEFKAGDLIALPGPDQSAARAQLIYSPGPRQSLKNVAQTKDALIIESLNDIQGQLARAYMKGAEWKIEPLPFPGQGTLDVVSSDSFTNEILVGFESFLVPSSILLSSIHPEHLARETKIDVLKRLPARFNSADLHVQQLWATSRDGTAIPYFLIGSKKMKMESKNPVILYGYGGFEISLTPTYLGLTGKLWLEKGGVYALANIRGGGEFGPAWHQAALKENRQRAFDDFIAVAEDLIKNKITGPEHLAIKGGSNGGLLVSSAFVQRPDLFRAVICSVPLTDMLRYNKLLAGASWMAEYGDPDKPNERAYLERYSPYQNVKTGVKYPEILFMTSTMDDRVHPGHARKLAEKMREQGHPLLYYENTEGGHAGSANLLQRVQFSSLEFTYLRDRLLH